VHPINAFSVNSPSVVCSAKFDAFPYAYPGVLGKVRTEMAYPPAPSPMHAISFPIRLL
jgi:hypothetical protein